MRRQKVCFYSFSFFLFPSAKLTSSSENIIFPNDCCHHECVRLEGRNQSIIYVITVINFREKLWVVSFRNGTASWKCDVESNHRNHNLYSMRGEISVRLCRFIKNSQLCSLTLKHFLIWMTSFSKKFVNLLKRPKETSKAASEARIYRKGIFKRMFIDLRTIFLVHSRHFWRTIDYSNANDSPFHLYTHHPTFYIHLLTLLLIPRFIFLCIETTFCIDSSR